MQARFILNFPMLKLTMSLWVLPLGYSTFSTLPKSRLAKTINLVDWQKQWEKIWTIQASNQKRENSGTRSENKNQDLFESLYRLKVYTLNKKGKKIKSQVTWTFLNLKTCYVLVPRSLKLDGKCAEPSPKRFW